MDNSIPAFRPDVVSVQTAQRPTPMPVRVRFSEVLASGARALVQGAQAAVGALPGAPLLAVAVRSGAASLAAPLETSAGLFQSGGAGLLSATAPEGPSAAGVVGLGLSASTPTTPDGGLESSLAQSQAMNLYYLHIQEEVNTQSRTFTALSNVLEVEHNTAKSAISNIH